MQRARAALTLCDPCALTPAGAAPWARGAPARRRNPIDRTMERRVAARGARFRDNCGRECRIRVRNGSGTYLIRDTAGR